MRTARRDDVGDQHGDGHAQGPALDQDGGSADESRGPEKVDAETHPHALARDHVLVKAPYGAVVAAARNVTANTAPPVANSGP
jgi:hypothetical protein